MALLRKWIRQSWNGQYGWRWMFTMVAIPAVIFFVILWKGKWARSGLLYASCDSRQPPAVDGKR